MATETADKPQEKAQVKASQPPSFGAYGATAYTKPTIAAAVDNTPQTKPSGSLDFTDADKRWLKDLGITTTDPNSFHKVWRTDQQQYEAAHSKWANTYTGRIGMRTVSRGIVGAAFYAAGNMYVDHAMTGYNPEVKFSELKGPLQFIAKCIDKTAGKGIKTVYEAVTHDKARAEKIVMGFRDTKYYSGYKADHKGRSLGDEAMMVTFDFAAMSFGDYMTRYFIGLMDPNAKKKWIKDGHIDIPGGLKDLLQNVFRGVTYAAGEDMAVAIPYVYYMRFQRHFIDKSSPGFKYDADRSLDGGSYKWRHYDNAKPELGGHIVGDYQLEGMLHLMGRFSVYNVGTKMFRDAYSQVQTHYEHFRDRWHDGDHSLPKLTLNPASLTPSGIAHHIGHAARYLARTTIKVMTYMIPATFAFAIIRSPQQKVRGIVIHAEKDGHGMLGRIKPGWKWDPTKSQIVPVKKESKITDKESQKDKDNDQEGMGTSETGSGNPGLKEIGTGSSKASDLNPDYKKPGYKRANQPFEEDMVWFGVDKDGKNKLTEFKSEYPFSMGKTYDENGKFQPARTRRDTFTDKYYNGNPPWYHNKFTAPIAEFCYNAGHNLNATFQASAKKFNNFFNPFLGTEGSNVINLSEWGTEKFSRLDANASLAYAPYLMLKTDTLSAEWDTKRTDMAIDRTLDGIGHLNWGEFKAGFGEIRRAMMREPFTDPKREEIAQKDRWGRDPEHRSNAAFQFNGVNYSDNDKSDQHHTGFAHEGLKSKKVIPAPLTQLKPREPNASWVAQEAVRKFQQETPSADGQSLH